VLLIPGQHIGFLLARFGLLEMEQNQILLTTLVCGVFTPFGYVTIAAIRITKPPRKHPVGQEAPSIADQLDFFQQVLPITVPPPIVEGGNVPSLYGP
jgi:hypothetical protein